PLLHTRLVDVGWTVDRVGLVLNVLAPSVSLGAAVLAGTLLTRIDGWRLLLVILPLEALCTFALLPLAAGAAASPFTLPAILGLFCAHNAASTVVVTLIMGRAEPGSEGSDFSSQHSLFLLTGFAAGGLALQLAGSQGYANALFAATALMALAFAACALMRPGMQGASPLPQAGN
ncbi:MAG: hypothetical protein MJH10_21750, partial [Epibacterium sp.]|nr:hypothetical protein [Epibacterium sp.]NQX76075.1 hypothetical protein [Epibacterium sp.]